MVKKDSWNFMPTLALFGRWSAIFRFCAGRVVSESHLVAPLPLQSFCLVWHRQKLFPSVLLIWSVDRRWKIRQHVCQRQSDDDIDWWPNLVHQRSTVNKCLPSRPVDGAQMKNSTTQMTNFASCHGRFHLKPSGNVGRATKYQIGCWFQPAQTLWQLRLLQLILDLVTTRCQSSFVLFTAVARWRRKKRKDMRYAHRKVAKQNCLISWLCFITKCVSHAPPLCCSHCLRRCRRLASHSLSHVPDQEWSAQVKMRQSSGLFNFFFP